jgi:ribonuclease BN (tRNA processing enzyme)
MSFRVIVLGSGTIIPSVERRSTALLVEAGEEPFLFDCGPGTLEALAECGVSFRSLHTVLLTHFHPDHSLGLAHLLAALKADPVAGERHAVAVYGPAGLRGFVERLHACFSATVLQPGVLELVEVGDGMIVPVRGAIAVSAAAASHGGVPALAYRISDGSGSVVFTGDGSLTPSLVGFSRRADVLVAECSFPDTRPAEGHLTPSDVGRLASSAAAGRVILVHMYPLFDVEDPVAGVKRHYRGPVEVAFDSMEFDIGPSRP